MKCNRIEKNKKEQRKNNKGPELHDFSTTSEANDAKIRKLFESKDKNPEYSEKNRVKL